ncbi:cerato-platanin [Purpureocillium lavendulum]|uniref:Cerato-platanin n=1 Tax=Purpureocillium lavendulum TaxID=1247861 RepID=A0AB34FNM7_9HYPO|nr:cerato-platanin [Purpureocillium lavendulum]
MHFSQLLSIAALAATALADTVSYDKGYDDRGRQLTDVACSDGANGLITRKGWHTQGDIPKFPYIGGVGVVAGWNSPECGSCWKLEYKGRSITVLAIDHAASGFNIALAAMNDLTNGNAEQLGRIDATATRALPADCGM